MMKLTWDQLCELLAIDEEGVHEKRYACRVYAALFRNHWTPAGPTGCWQYIGSYMPAQSLDSVRSAIGGDHEDVMEDEIWKDLEGK